MSQTGQKGYVIVLRLGVLSRLVLGVQIGKEKVAIGWWMSGRDPTGYVRLVSR